MRLNSVLTVTLLSFMITPLVNAESVEPSKATSDVKQVEQDDEPDAPKQLSLESMAGDEFDLPSIGEIYEQANRLGISANWSKVVQVQAKDYKTMTVSERAFEVGKTLSDVAFLVLDGGNADAPPPKALVQHAYDAILSLQPPAAINVQLQGLRDQLEAGTLRGKELRTQVDILIDETVHEILETEASLRDVGTFVLAIGYFRAMYLGTSTVAGYKNPTPEQVSMFSWGNDNAAGGSIIDYFIKYFNKKATPAFRDSAEVMRFRIVLKKVKPLLDKKPETIVKDDVAKIAEILQPLFK